MEEEEEGGERRRRLSKAIHTSYDRSSKAINKT